MRSKARFATASWWRRLCAALLVALSIVSALGPAAAPAAAATPPRRVNVWPTTGTINWATAPIFWFGQATYTGTNSNDYVDVRVAYDNQNLYVFATIEDSYLWYDPTGAADPRTYDAFALYLDTGSNLASAPQSTSYYFVSGYGGNDPRYQRQGQGTGSGWNTLSVPSWTQQNGDRYYNSGPNNNSDLDAGWANTMTIPWPSVGQAGPPAPGAAWGMGAILYNRQDQPPAGAVAPEYWPETMNPSSPASWGRIAFNPSLYQPPPSANQQTVTIRRGLNASFTQSTYAGGGGGCGGGVYGGGDQPHDGATESLYVQNEADISDFPCFSKTYLQFDLSAIPAGKVIQSASLTLNKFGNSDPSGAQPSYIQVFSLRDAWSEQNLTWNNAPLASANYPGATVAPTATADWVLETWDVTALIGDSFAAGQSANLALYSADTAYHSGKYFVACHVDDWCADAGPTLTVTYGDPVLGLSGSVAPPVGATGTVFSYAFNFTGDGNPLQLNVPLPVGLSFVNGSQSSGVTFDASAQTVRWSGTPAVGQRVTISYQATVAATTSALATTSATLTSAAGSQSSTTVLALMNPYQVNLPATK